MTRIVPSVSSTVVAALFGAALLVAAGGWERAWAQRRPQAQPAAAARPALAPESYSQLRYRYVGPVGNRFTSVAGIPGDPNVYYAGAASGGIWKTTDGGVHWSPIFDDYGVQSIGALAIAPSNPNIVWAGTGEAHVRSHISSGNGIYQSLDAGKTWTRMGLEHSGRIARVVIHPQNPDIVFACSQGHSYGPQPDRGVFRTADGGKTWDKVLFADEHTGCSDVAMDPTNPAILFARFWTIEIRTWGRTSGGPHSGLYASRDGGTTWKRLRGNGLPRMDVGKTVVGIARSNPHHVYALIETGDGVPVNGAPQESGELWTSTDGGDTWTLTSHDRQLGGRTHYYSRVVVSPDNDNEVYFLSAAFSKSIDGGRSVENLGFGSSPGGDNHDIWIDPTNGDRMIVANDQGLAISTTRGRQWDQMQLPVAQMYHVTTDNSWPYRVCSGQQESGSACVPSRGNDGQITFREWHPVAVEEVDDRVLEPGVLGEEVAGREHDRHRSALEPRAGGHHARDKVGQEFGPAGHECHRRCGRSYILTSAMAQGIFIDIERWKRREHYLHYRRFARPFWSLTTEVDVTVVATVSNWGAYGIQATLAAVTRNRDIIHVPALEQRMLHACTEAGGVDGRRPSQGRAVLVDVACPIRAVRIDLQGEEPGAERRQEAARGAHDPARKRGDGDADQRRLVERSRRGAVGDGRRGQEPLHLATEVALNGGEEPRLIDLRRVRGLPVIESHDHDREPGEIDDRADPEAQQDLARPELTDAVPRALPAHVVKSGPGLGSR